MLTLHKATEATKTIAKWASVSIVSILILVILIRALVALKESVFPTPPPVPTVGYGKLPAIEFEGNATNAVLDYSIDTVTGKLPAFGTTAKVHKIIHPSANLLGPQRAQDQVKKINFFGPGIPVSESVYEWTSAESLQKTLTVDINSFNFALFSDFMSNPTVLAGGSLPSQAVAENTAKTFLSNLNTFPTDIDTQKTKIALFAIDGQHLVPSTSLSNSGVIRVDFYQKDVDKLPIFYPRPPYSTMNLKVAAGERSEGEVVEAEFYHYDIEGKSETYPIKTADQAFTQLKEGKAYIASYAKGNTNVSIKNVYLGYYLGQSKQDYLMPVVIFEGNNNFFAYINAIADEWIEN